MQVSNDASQLSPTVVTAAAETRAQPESQQAPHNVCAAAGSNVSAIQFGQVELSNDLKVTQLTTEVDDEAAEELISKFICRDIQINRCQILKEKSPLVAADVEASEMSVLVEDSQLLDVGVEVDLKAPLLDDTASVDPVEVKRANQLMEFSTDAPSDLVTERKVRNSLDLNVAQPEADGDKYTFDSDSEEEQDFGSAASNPFNLIKLTECISDDVPALDSVKGKDKILVIGKTGTDKSTLIQAVAGKTLCCHTRKIVLHDGAQISKILFDAEDALPEFMIGHGKSSQTKHILCHSRQRSEGDTVMYVDCPGYEDTASVEVDITTSVMLRKSCRTE